MMADKILFVDDDKDILDTFKRLMRKRYSIDTAIDGEKGLEAISSRGPYAVVVSDMRMPGMDGVRFLAKVMEISPDSVRVMLTGNADQQTAIEAVNQGRIFRFLTKPCSPELFSITLDAAIGQHKLIISERELLEKTLSRSIKVLIDILSMVNPTAFGRAARLRKYVKHMAAQLGLKNAWQYELAAMLSQIGCVTIPQETMEKYYSGGKLSDDEAAMLGSHPSVGKELLEKVPRLEQIALMIEQQDKPYSMYRRDQPPDKRPEAEIGAQMIKAAIELDLIVSQGGAFDAAIGELADLPERCDPVIVATMKNMDVSRPGKTGMVTRVVQLMPGMVLGQNVYTKKGLLLAHKGQEISLPLKERLANFWHNGFIEDKVRVLIK